MDTRKRYKITCPYCGTVQYACKSILHEMGTADGGHGICLACGKDMRLTFNDKEQIGNGNWNFKGRGKGKMERLTFKAGGFNAFNDKNMATYGGMQKDGSVIYIGDVANKLAEYEDLEEQGLLLKLPCKVGDKLYVVNPRKDILELTVKEFSYRAYRIPRLEVYFEDANGFETCLFDGTLNENVFLTQAEAEEALKEMESEEK